MQNFLDQTDACFYHITTFNSWQIIKNQGLLRSSGGQIFVSRIGELPILLAIALEQLPEIYKTEEIVFLKLPQQKNHFIVAEIRPDHQATEWTQPFQNIILRHRIPIEQIELMMTLKLGIDPQRTCIINYITRIASAGQENYQNHSIYLKASEIVY